MEKKPLTHNQELARDARSGNYIVSASAGSGKTFVLTKRVFDVINEGTKLSELLVLTFTNAAAAEMRDRIRAYLVESGNEEAKNIASSLDAANIQTYDAYALNLVKKYHDRIGLPQDIKLVDAVLLNIEKNKLITKILENAFDEKNERVLKLVNDYCYKSFDKLKEFIITLSDKFDLVEDKKSYLNSFVSLYINEKAINSYIEEFLISFRKKMDEFYSLIKAFNSVDYIENNLELIERLSNVKDYDELYFILITQKCTLNGRSKYFKENEDEKAKHKYFNSYLKSIKDNFLRYENKQEIVDQYLGNKGNIETILSLVSKLDEALNEYKRYYNVYTFADIFKFAMKIVDIPDIQKELKEKYKYIMIDEYQDTSDLQEKFIEKIANNNVYVVGDVKQSIYRFRNANSDIFLKKFIEYGKNNGGKRIELPDNFRSRKEVIGTVNYIFELIMSISNSGLDYKKEHEMIASNDKYLPSKDSYETEFISYTPEDLEAMEMGYKEYEARLVATDIAKKIRDKFQVYDHKEKKLRDCQYKDFAILMSVKGEFDLYQKIFNEYQIPFYAKYERTTRDNRLSMVFENIVRLLVKTKFSDRSKGYKHAYISLMRSFVMNASDEEVDRIGSTERYEDYCLFDMLDDLSKQNEGKNLKEQVSNIISYFDLYNRLITIGNVSDSISLMEYFYNIASQMDDMGYTLEDFVEYFDDLEKYEIEPEFSPNDDIENSVQLMTIHASKGLQFKICYFPNLAHKFNYSSVQGKFLFDKHYGIVIPNVHSKAVDLFTKELVVKKEKEESIKEQIRLLYVALTRAEEKIIFVGNRDKNKEKTSFFESNSFLDFLNFEHIKINERSFVPELIKGEIKEKEVDGKVNIHATPKMDGLKKEITHASKSLDEDSDSELLRLGQKYHYYLEISDFKSKDASFIKNEKDKRLITRFLNSELFKDASKARILHEYAFFDEINNVSGVIDLLLIYDDRIDIVDFKLSHVDDEAYEKQLGKYKAYISQLSKLPIRTYVAGIMSGNVKAVKEANN